MKIVRQDDDTLVLEATSSDDGKGKQFIAIVACLIFPAIVGFLFVRRGWWAELDATGQTVAAISLAAAVLALLFVVSGMFPYLGCLALDRSTRRALCVWKTLRRTRSEEFGFDRFERVKVRQTLGTGGRQWWTLRMERSSGQAIELSMHEFRDAAGKTQAQALAAQMCDMLGLDQSPKARKGQSPAEKRFMRVIVYIGGPACFALAIAAATGISDMWQAPTWPKASGVVDSFQFYTRHRGKALADLPAVHIKYRYSVGGAEYHGHRFNIDHDMLSKREIDFINLHCQPGQACEVSYNPSDPARSFMTTTDAHYYAAVEAAACGVLALFGLACMIFSVRLLALGNWRLLPRRPNRHFSAGSV
jgi:hypothetical protein